MQIGLLGLGKMGRGIMEKLLREGHEVVAWNRSKEIVEQIKIEKSDYVVSGKLKLSFSIEGMRESLANPRVFWLMLPAGEATDTILSEIASMTEPGDIIVDGGNSNYKDTDRRYKELTPKGIKYLGIGVSGGIHGLDDGFCIMAGGNKDGYDYIQPALESLSKPGAGYNYFGEGGAGHFVKMVHNGIEYGMMQALAEGFGVLARSEYNLNLLDVGIIYQQGSIVRSFLTDMAVNALQDPEFTKIEGVIASTGEGKWTVEAGKEFKVPVNVIEESLKFRDKSQYDKAVQNTFAAKMVAALRNQFGGHSVQKGS